MKIKYKIENIRQHQENGLTVNEQKYYDKWKVLPSKFHLTNQKEYVVYGIDYDVDNNINFLIMDDTGVSYPKFYPSEFFNVIDFRISQYWFGEYNEKYPISNIVLPKFISLKEIVKDDSFFDDLLDSKNNKYVIFTKYKEFIDNEFPEDSLEFAKKINDNWLFCAYCDESFEAMFYQGVVCCPKCKKRNNNPFWVMVQIS